jgi:hypothetical protein
MRRATHASSTGVPAAPTMTDAERILSLLLHDLRTPLGVAHGYLRLIRTDKLPGPADRDRALAGTQDALAKLSRLCEDTTRLLGDGPDPAIGHAAAAALVDGVAAALDARGIPVEVAETVEGSVAVGPDLDRCTDAVAALLATRAPRSLGGEARIDATGAELCFACGPAGDGTILEAQASGNRRPFDPWLSAPSIPIVSAHRLLIALGGRAWTSQDGRRITLSVPLLETRNE